MISLPVHFQLFRNGHRKFELAVVGSIIGPFPEDRQDEPNPHLSGGVDHQGHHSHEMMTLMTYMGNAPIFRVQRQNSIVTNIFLGCYGKCRLNSNH